MIRLVGAYFVGRALATGWGGTVLIILAGYVAVVAGIVAIVAAAIGVSRWRRRQLLEDVGERADVVPLGRSRGSRNIAP